MRGLTRCEGIDQLRRLSGQLRVDGVFDLADAIDEFLEELAWKASRRGRLELVHTTLSKD